MTKDKFNQKVFDLHGDTVEINYLSKEGRKRIIIKWECDPTKSYIVVGNEKINHNQIYSISRV